MKYIGYFWGNFYMATIQQGIQGMHVVGKMSQNVTDENKESFKRWAGQDFTVQLMNGGDHESLNEFVEFLDIYAPDKYIWSSFYESEGALNQSTSSVGIILPDWVADPSHPPMSYDDSFEADMYRKIKKSRFAI